MLQLLGNGILSRTLLDGRIDSLAERIADIAEDIEGSQIRERKNQIAVESTEGVVDVALPFRTPGNNGNSPLALPASNSGNHALSVVLALTIVKKEKERLLLDHRTAEAAAELVPVRVRQRLARQSLKPVLCTKLELKSE